MSGRQRAITSSPRTGTTVNGFPADQRCGANSVKSDVRCRNAKRRRERRAVRRFSLFGGQTRNVERRMPAVGTGRLHPAGHEADVFLKHEIARLAASVETREQHGRSDRRMPRETEARAPA